MRVSQPVCNIQKTEKLARESVSCVLHACGTSTYISQHMNSPLVTPVYVHGKHVDVRSSFSSERLTHHYEHNVIPIQRTQNIDHQMRASMKCDQNTKHRRTFQIPHARVPGPGIRRIRRILSSKLNCKTNWGARFTLFTTIVSAPGTHATVYGRLYVTGCAF